MREPNHSVKQSDWEGVNGAESMRQRLASKFGPMWACKSPAEMLYEMAHWCGPEGPTDGLPEGGVVAVTRDTLLALAVYAGIMEADRG